MPRLGDSGVTGERRFFGAASDEPTELKGTGMNKDQVKGRVDQAKGSVKENVGKAMDDPKLRDKGTADKAKGKAQATYGDAKEKVKDAVDKM